MRRRAAPAGLRLEAHKERPLEHPISCAPPPRTAILALDQGSGEDAEPVVGTGARVRVGSLVARGRGAAANLHAPVAGTVSEIALRPTAAGIGRCIAIESDGTDENEDDVARLDWSALDGSALLERLRAAGIAGLGGAAFPTADKLELARTRHAAQLVLNGAECEPWICCDDALMRERAGEVVLGAQVLLAACGAARCTIAVEDDKPQANEAIAAALAAAADARLELEVLPAVYPLGAERQLIAAVTGREIPQDELPQTAGVLCQNVGTAAAAARFVATGLPLVSRIVTVTGSAIARPANVEARIGTPLADLIASCGGYASEPRRLVLGGSMTGRTLPGDAVPATKGTNCVIAATESDLVTPGPEVPCIRCGDCATVCPAGLLPQQLHRAAIVDDAAALARLGLAACIECGCCDYVCPSQIPLTARFRAAHERERERETGRRRAAEARTRYERHERRIAEQAEVERREFEEARHRARGDSVR